MKQQPNPTPMLADASTHDDVRELLTFARAQGPNQADLDRLATRLSPLVGVAAGDLSAPLSEVRTAPANPTGTNPALGVAGKAATKLSLSAMGKVLVAASVMSLGAFWWVSSSAPMPQSLPSRPPVQVELRSAPAVELPATEDEPPTVTESPALPRELPSKIARRAPPAAPNLNVELDVTPPPSEIELIRRAEALRSQPANALVSLNEHARLYPSGMLAQEREVLAIEALLASGQREAAQARADRLAIQYPGSAHLRRVRVLLGAGLAE